MIRTWISIALWAGMAAVVAVATCAIVVEFYPDLHPGILFIAAFLAVQVVYLARVFARQRGWAIASYAPQVKQST